jgi:hypothetical protein
MTEACSNEISNSKKALHDAVGGLRHHQQASRPRWCRALRSEAQDFRGALEEAFKLIRFDAPARIASVGTILRGNRLVFEWLH